MYLKVGLHLVKECCDGTQLLLTEGDTVIVKKRNYQVEGGIETITGVIDSILSATNEIRLDTSATLQSKYTTLSFGQIVDIEKVVPDEDEPGDEDPATFDVATKRVVTVAIPALLRRIIDELPECHCGVKPTPDHGSIDKDGQEWESWSEGDKPR